MKALLLKDLHQALDFQEVETPTVDLKHAVVNIRAAALNHRDVWIQKGQYAAIRLPTILGSDGAGECDGQEVVIYPAMSWGKSQRVQSADFRVLGMPDAGTFAEQIRVPRANIFPKPRHLDFEKTAALPVAGLTAWRLLFTRCKLKKGEKILITGIGGGVALMAMQLALAAGAEVFVTSGTDEKIEKSVQLGARAGVNYRADEWEKLLKKEAGGFDVVFDSAGGEQFSKLVGLCNPGGRVGLFGGALGKWSPLSPQLIFWKQLSILGSSMGSPQEFGRMLAFVEKKEIVPVVDSVFPLAEGNLAMEKLASGRQFGKIVLSIV